MIPLVKSVWNDLMYSPEKARIWLRGVLLWAGTIGAMVGSADYRAWTAKDWAIRLVAAGVVGAGGLVSVGEKNK